MEEAEFNFVELIQELRKKTEEAEATSYRCSECGSEMIRRKSKWGTDKYWWGCSNYPNCKHTEKG